jgi:hypothetical protein
VVFDRPSIAGLAGALASKLGWDEEDAALDTRPSAHTSTHPSTDEDDDDDDELPGNHPPGALADALAERIARLESLVRVP